MASETGQCARGVTAEAAPSSVSQVRAWLSSLDVDRLSDRERVDLVADLERLKNAAAATQARATHALRTSREAASPQDAVRSVGAEVALARRQSPSLGDRYVGMARALVTEMPCTMQALESGSCSERHAQTMVQLTSVLSLEHRTEVDRRVGPLLGRLGLRGTEAAARRVAAELDAAAVVRRMEDAVRSRRVTVRPAPDGMAYLTVLGPMVEVVGASAALQARARAVVGGQCPDEPPQGRSAGAVAADTALALMSGRAPGQPQPIEVHLVMTDRSLLGTGDPDRSVMEPARLPGHGPLPAPVARARLRDVADGGRPGVGSPLDGELPFVAPFGEDPTDVGSPLEGKVPSMDIPRWGDLHDPPPQVSGISTDPHPAVPPVPAVPALPAVVQDVGPVRQGSATGAVSEAATVWLRRLYTSPDGRSLVAMDSRRRVFDGLLRRMLVLRDDVCSTPWCEAPIAHADHTIPVRAGGVTSFTTGTGKCARCNYGKEAPGWATVAVAVPPDGPLCPDRVSALQEVRITTPAGRQYASQPPPLLGWGQDADGPPPDATAPAGGVTTAAASYPPPLLGRGQDAAAPAPDATAPAGGVITAAASRQRPVAGDRRRAALLARQALAVRRIRLPRDTDLLLELCRYRT